MFQVGTALKFPHTRREHSELSETQATDQPGMGGARDMRWLDAVVWYNPFTWTRHIATAWFMIGTWLFGVFFCYWRTWYGGLCVCGVDGGAQLVANLGLTSYCHGP